MSKKVINPEMCMKKFILIFLMENETIMFKILLVMFLKEISTYLYMMNVRMTTWMMHLKNQKPTITDQIIYKKLRALNGMSLRAFQFQNVKKSAFLLIFLKKGLFQMGDFFMSFEFRNYFS